MSPRDPEGVQDEETDAAVADGAPGEYDGRQQGRGGAPGQGQGQQRGPNANGRRVNGGQNGGQTPPAVEVAAPVPVPEEVVPETPATPGLDGAALDAVAKKVRNLNKKVRIGLRGRVPWF